MTQIGVAFEGKPDIPHKQLDNGYVVPDVSISEVLNDHRRQLQNQIALSVYAEECGYDYVLHPELHFSLTGANSPNPILTQAVVAERTDELRLLQSTNVLPWHDPVRLAEQLAMLDVISDGRVEVGVGTGHETQALEAETLGQYWGGSSKDRLKNRQSFEEKYDILIESWTKEFLSHRGPFHQVPPSHTEWEHDLEYQYLADESCEHEPGEYFHVDGETTTAKSLLVSPKPEQHPHPQMWTSASSRYAVEWAAHQGANMTCVARDFSLLEDVVERYYDETERAGWPDHRPEHDGQPFRYGWDEDRRRGVACVLPIFNMEVATEETFERWRRGQEFALASIKSTLPPERAADFEIDFEEFAEKMDAPVVGTSEEIIEVISKLKRTCGYEDFAVFITVDVPGIGVDEVETQVRAFAEDVAPHV